MNETATKPEPPAHVHGDIADDMLAALREAESALAIRASLRDGEQARVQRALETIRAAIRRAEGGEP